MIKEWLTKKVRDCADKNFTNKITMNQPAGTMALMNNYCQFNAVNAVKTGRAVAVVEVVCIDRESCTAHYVNMLEDGSFVDYTLGWSWTGGDYRLIRYVHESLYERINKELEELKGRLCQPISGKLKLTLYSPTDIC